MYGHIYSKSKGQLGNAANPARGHLNRDFFFLLFPFGLRIWSRETASAVPSRVSLLISILRRVLTLSKSSNRRDTKTSTR